MSKLQNLQQALNSSSGKAAIAKPAQAEAAEASDAVKSSTGSARAAARKGKEYTGAWLKQDFGTSLRLVQIRKRKNADGKKVFLDDIFAEALNDLFIKYDVPTVMHE